MLVHGLWGRPSDWDVVAERLDEHKQRLEGAGTGGGKGEREERQQQQEHLRVLKSRANARRLTLDGIDVCASRLAAEVRAAVAEERKKFGEEARLERVSFVGHSMGGLIARAAVAELLDNELLDTGDGDGKGGDEGEEGGARTATATTKKLTLAGGLLPAHFVSIATPHLGCHAEAEATAAFVAASRAAAAASAASVVTAAAEETAAAAAGEKREKEQQQQQLRQHPALIPLVSWIAGASPPAPLSSSFSTVAPRLLAAAASRASSSMGRSGPQFFLADGEEEGEGEGEEGEGKEGGGAGPRRRPRPPLLARLADPALPALRALAAFESRTTFANSSGDHLVGWSNASLRDPRELPREELRAATTGARRGVEEGEAAAAKAAAKEEVGGGGGEGEASGGGGWSSSSSSFFSRRRRAAAAAAAAAAASKEGGVGVVLDDGVAAAFEHKKKNEGTGGEGEGERKRQGKKKDVDEEDENLDVVDRMLSSLRALPWRRVDACFRGSPTPFLAHNHIQATHFFNERVGRASADAIARAVVEADEELLRRRRRAKKGGEE